jgi:two-component system alkaline phosphatase synthesis response regulator PhoP
MATGRIENRGKKILIVEDDSSLVKIYKIELEIKGFEVIEAQDGEEGLKKTLEGKPDLVLLDIMMPKLNGLDVLEKIRQDEKTENIPVIMLTNFGQEYLVKRAFELKATDYLLKYQTTPIEVVRKINSVLEEPTGKINVI